MENVPLRTKSFSFYEVDQAGNEVPLLTKFCCCIGLETGIHFIAFCDVILAMVYFSLTIYDITDSDDEKGIWLFPLIYCIICLIRIFYHF